MMSAVCIRSTVSLLSCRNYRPAHRSILIWQNIIRSIATVGPINQKVQMTRMLEKMLKKGGKKKWSGAHTSVFATPDGKDRRGTYKVTEGNRRRCEQVGKVLYDYIVSLVNSGELHPELVENSVEIATVKMAVDFSGINVYWYATGKESDVNTQLLLDKNAGKLREMLISLRIIGNVPKISFVQDLTQAKVAELDRLLKMADMGPSEEETSDTEQEFDHIDPEQQISEKGHSYSPSMLNRKFKKKAGTFDTFPSNYTSLQNSETLEELNVGSIQSEVTEVNVRGDKSGMNLLKERGSNSADNGFHSSIPFRHDVYSLNREELVKKVIALRNKGKHKGIDQDFQPNEDLSFPPVSTLKHVNGKNRKLTPLKLPKLKEYSMADYLSENQDHLTGTSSPSDNEGFDSYVDDDYVEYEEKKH